jgi:hypothetical protein
VLELDPNFTVEGYLETLHYKEQGDLEHHREGLLKAGLPRDRVEKRLAADLRDVGG